MTASRNSAFFWYERREPSIFATDSAFTGCKKTGKTHSQSASEAVDRYVEKTGKNPGSISGISSHGDRLIERAVHDRRAAR